MLLARTRCLSIFALMSFALALVLSCLPVSAAAQTAAIVPVASRLTQPIDETQLVTLKGTMHRLATPANDRGAVDSGLALERMQVMLKRSPAQESALEQAIQQMHQPGSASYHKWLTPAEFGEQFGPSDADIATLSTWLGSHGFAVTKVNPGKQTLEFSGSAGQFQKTFHTAIHRFLVDGQMHTANAGDPSIPAALAPVFGGFASLNNFPVKSYAKVMGHASYTPATHKAVPDWTVGDPTNGYSFLLGPGDFAVQYDLNPLYAAGTKGAGQTIGIINEANISISLVDQYRSLFGLPANPVNVIIDGNDPGIDGVNNPDGPNRASVEAYLDVEMVGAVAPAATVDLIVAADTALFNGLGLAAEHAVYGNTAPVLSISFGSCEAGGGSGFWNGLWEQAAAQGQTVMVSTGDAGSAGCDNDNTQAYAVYGQQVNGIASTPWNVGVGGTDFYYSSYGGTVYGSGTVTLSQAELTQLQTYWGNFQTSASNLTPTTTLLTKVPEQPWNDSQFGLNLFNQYTFGNPSSIAGGGGGASNCATGVYGSTTNPCMGYAKPSWQAGTGVPADGVRDLPDVSLFASNGSNFTYYPICAQDGDCQPVSSGTVQITGIGGTSASSPAFAGMMALVNEKYGPQGQADFVLYPLAKQYPTAFNDVTNGTNSMPCNLQQVSANGNSYAPTDCLTTSTSYSATDSTYGYSTEGQIGNTSTNVAEYNAGVGYDLASGLGTIDANNLVTNWGNVKFTASGVTLTPSSTSFVHGTAITISGTVTPGTSSGNVALETTSSILLNPADAANTAFAVTGGTFSGFADWLPGGTYQIYGAYGGDGINAPSTSAKTSITVTPEASTTMLRALNSASVQPNGSVAAAFQNGATLPYGTQIVLTAQPGASIGNTTTVPTGTVTFLNGTIALGTIALNVNGEASLNYAPAVSATQYSITAKYSGDASYNASISGTPVVFTVTQDSPVLSLTSSTQTTSTIAATSGASALTVGVENYTNYGLRQQTGNTFNTPAVAPTGVVTLTGLPSGTLTFPALGAVIDPVTYQIEGVATLLLPTETPGTYPVTLSYPGDASYAPNTSNTSVTIAGSTLIPTTTTATVLSAATSFSSPAQVTFTITGTSTGGAPTGSVSFVVSGQNFGSLTLPSGGTGSSVTQTITLNGLTGTNEIVVQYSGNSTYAPSSAVANIENGGAPAFGLSDGGAITVPSGAAGTATSTVSVAPFNGFTGSVALACAVTPTTGPSVPTCTVTGPVALSGTSSTPATLTVATTATTGAGNYTATVTATSGGLVQTLQVPLTVASISLANSGAITIASPGGSGTSTITVVNLGSIAVSSVNLSCSVTGSTSTDAPACSLTPVASGSGGAATSTLTVTTTASAALELPRLRMLPLGGGVAVAALLFFLVPMKRRRLSTLLGLALLMAAVGFGTGCGSGSGSAPSNPGTPAGTYTVTVSGTANAGPIAPTTVTVTVQ